MLSLARNLRVKLSLNGFAVVLVRMTDSIRLARLALVTMTYGSSRSVLVTAIGDDVDLIVRLFTE